MTSNSNIDDLFPCISCGVNADPADGFGKCTCGNEAKREAIQQELLKARIDEISILRNGYGWGDALETSEYILDDRLDDLQAKLKGDDK
jgi:hypothetical protein